MHHPHRKAVAIAGLSVFAVVGLSACSSGSSSEAAPSSSTAAPMTTSVAATPAAPTLIGAGCASYAQQVPSGPGSVEGMAQDPVAVAASNNPMLTTLTAALSGKLNPNVNLVDTLNNGEYTVFAPTDDAFKKLPPSTIEARKADSAALTNILTYHVVPGQASPNEIVGTHKTVQGESVTVTGMGDSLKVNNASVVCG